MKSHASLLAMLAIAAGTLLGAASGCELIAGVDRNKINETGGGGEGGTTSPQGGGGTTSVSTTTNTEGGGGTTSSSTTGCMDASECPDPGADCKVAACDTATGMCGEANAPDGTEAPDQEAGNCSKNVCSGGVVVPEADPTDPEDDDLDCTMDACDELVPTHTPITGIGCDDAGGQVCDDPASGACVECNTDAHCLNNPNGNTKCDPTHVCVPASCGDLTLNGDETDVDCGGPVCGKCADDLTCVGSGDCQSNNCDATVCVAGTCFDGILNNTQLGETDVDCGGSSCPQCPFDKDCVINADCVGGSCAGSKCEATCTDTEKNQDESDVDCGGVCDNCENGDDCNDADDCESNFCNGGGACAPCNNDGQCAAAEYCSTGVCVPDLMTGTPCTAGTQCQTNNCVDNVCCGDATCGTCEACNVAGQQGACNLVGAGQTDDTCNMAGKQCDALGACKSLLGQTCAAAGDCLSNFCVDTVCCNIACNTACRSCSLPGSVGNCANLTSGQDTVPTNLCVAPSACDATGVCKKTNGQTCAAAGECVSGNCVDGRCCGSSTCATCQSCAVTGSEGTCTNIASGQTDTNPAGTCIGVNSCDGMGTCKKNNGQTCGGAGECLTGNCIDNICCNTTCTGLCQACNVPSSFGTCTNAQAGTESGNECPSNPDPICNGEGACGPGGAVGVACVTGGCLPGLTCTGGVCVMM